MNEEQLRRDVAELGCTLTNDGHEIERIAPHSWKVTARLARGSEEKEKWFENFLDTDLYAVHRCKACGRAFLVLRVRDNSGTLISYVVTDEKGDDVDLTIEPLCLAKSAGRPAASILRRTIVALPRLRSWKSRTIVLTATTF